MGKGQIGNISDMAGSTDKRGDIWETDVLVGQIWDTFEIVVFKLILGSFGG